VGGEGDGIAVKLLVELLQCSRCCDRGGVGRTLYSSLEVTLITQQCVGVYYYNGGIFLVIVLQRMIRKYEFCRMVTL